MESDLGVFNNLRKILQVRNLTFRMSTFEQKLKCLKYLKFPDHHFLFFSVERCEVAQAHRHTGSPLRAP